jgi:hypothetical protein
MVKTPLQYLDHVPRKLRLGVLVHTGIAKWENQIPGTGGFSAFMATRLIASRNKNYVKCSWPLDCPPNGF